MRLGAHEIGLTAAAGEGSCDHDAALGGPTGGRLALVPDEDLQLIEQGRSPDGLLRVGHLLLVVLEGRRGAGQRRAAGAAVPRASYW